MNSQSWWDFPTSCFSCRGRKMRESIAQASGAAFLALTVLDQESVIQIIPEPLPQCYLCLLDAELTGAARGEDSSATPRSLSHSLANCMISENGLVSRLTALETGLLCLSHKQISPVSCRWRQNMVFKPNS
uniref:Uncharacterized protein n=1 Tax=Nomascus leucogenys TaxID=61853 RepID=A0A2I3GJZ8_NOMLE